MRGLAIGHEDHAGPGVFGEAIRERGDALEEWMVPTVAEPPGEPLDYDAVLVLGGAVNVDEGDAHPWLHTERALIGELLERRAPQSEIGWHTVDLTEAGRIDPLLGALAPSFEAFQWHSYEFPLPPGAVALARSDVSLQAARIGKLPRAIP